MNYTEIFGSLFSGFFQNEGIRSLPEEDVCTELVMDLREPLPCEQPLPCPDGITFGIYRGPLGPLHEAVHRVDPDWVQYFNEEDSFFCAFHEDRIVAFCNIAEMGRSDGLRVSGPGCVGTIPEYRKQGIGLEMVRLATLALREQGYDLSWIHYTHLESWYQKLGYQTVLRWNRNGFLPV